MKLNTGLDRVPGRLPLLPLPGVVLLPGSLLSIRIFEERYQKMVFDTTRGDRFLGVALLRDGWEKNYDGSPATHPVVGVGRILAAQDLPSGRINLLIVGLARGLIAEEIDHEPYRVARVRLLAEHRSPSRDVEAFARRSLLSALRGLLEIEPPSLVVWDRFKFFGAPLGVLVDYLAGNLALESRLRQSLLEETDVSRRASKLASALRSIIFELESRTARRIAAPAHTAHN